MFKASLPYLLLAGAIGLAMVSSEGVTAQQAAPAARQTPRARATTDYTGYWVSVVTEEWRWRMVTPPKGDFTSIPVSDEGRRVAGLWEPSMEGACQAYGAAGLMRMPGRLHITWENDDVLRVESDAGQQVRRLQFDPTGQPGARSLQGFSVAEWESVGGPGSRGGGRGGAIGLSLKVVTTNLAEGWLRRNGIAYSEATTLTEYWDKVTFPNGDSWLTVSQYVNDPRYLSGEYTTSMHFKLEADGSKFKPTPCRTVG